MLSIREFLVEHRKNPIGIAESAPGFWIESESSVGIVYQGTALRPQAEYTVRLNVWDNKVQETQTKNINGVPQK